MVGLLSIYSLIISQDLKKFKSNFYELLRFKQTKMINIYVYISMDLHLYIPLTRC